MIRLLLTVMVLSRLARGRRLKPPLAPGAPPPGGTVSVVIPARDEEARIAGALAPLRDERGVTEVLVVDDRSSDATAEVARAHGARVVAGAPLPEGWTGKVWALEQGLRAATGEFVVFLDADTRPEAGPDRCARRGGRPRRPGERRAAVRLRAPGRAAAAPELPGHAGLPLRAGRGRGLAAAGVAGGAQRPVRRRPARRAGRRRRLGARPRQDDRGRGDRSSAARTWLADRFEDAGTVLEVRMYESARETWTGWGRSLMAPDVTPRAVKALDPADAVAGMALPIPRLLLAPRVIGLDVLLAAVRCRSSGGYQGRTYAPRAWRSCDCRRWPTCRSWSG
jgi:dolichol-phosphate mannosyltransferase